LHKRWTKGLKGGAVKKEKDSLKASRESFIKLKVLLESDYEASLKEMRKQEHYDKANWSMYVADKMSEQRTLKKVIDLLPLD